MMVGAAPAASPVHRHPIIDAPTSEKGTPVSVFDGLNANAGRRELAL